MKELGRKKKKKSGGGEKEEELKEKERTEGKTSMNKD